MLVILVEISCSALNGLYAVCPEGITTRLLSTLETVAEYGAPFLTALTRTLDASDEAGAPPRMLPPHRSVGLLRAPYRRAVRDQQFVVVGFRYCRPLDTYLHLPVCCFHHLGSGLPSRDGVGIEQGFSPRRRRRDRRGLCGRYRDRRPNHTTDRRGCTELIGRRCRRQRCGSYGRLQLHTRGGGWNRRSGRREIRRGGGAKVVSRIVTATARGAGQSVHYVEADSVLRAGIQIAEDGGRSDVAAGHLRCSHNSTAAIWPASGCPSTPADRFGGSTSRRSLRSGPVLPPPSNQLHWRIRSRPSASEPGSLPEYVARPSKRAL